MNLSRTMKENEEASSYHLTTIYGRHHGPTMVLIGIEFCTLLILYGHGIRGASIGGQPTLK